MTGVSDASRLYWLGSKLLLSAQTFHVLIYIGVIPDQFGISASFPLFSHDTCLFDLHYFCQSFSVPLPAKLLMLAATDTPHILYSKLPLSLCFNKFLGFPFWPFGEIFDLRDRFIFWDNQCIRPHDNKNIRHAFQLNLLIGGKWCILYTE